MNAEVSYKFKKKHKSRGIRFAFGVAGLISGFFIFLASFPGSSVFSLLLLLASISIAISILYRRIFIIVQLNINPNEIEYYGENGQSFNLPFAEIRSYSFDDLVSSRQLSLLSTGDKKYKITQDKPIKGCKDLKVFEADFKKLIKAYNDNNDHQIEVGRSAYQSTFMRIWAVILILMIGFGLYFILFEEVQDKGAVFTLIGYLFIAIPMLIIFFKKNFLRRGSADK